MRVLVCGGRDYQDYGKMHRVLGALNWTEGSTIIHGAARGADSLASQFARITGITEYAYPADWKTHGKAAGPIRNRQMLNLCPHLVIAFPGGNGTAHMKTIARQSGVPVLEVT
jgi:hypothetical protein